LPVKASLLQPISGSDAVNITRRPLTGVLSSYAPKRGVVALRKMHRFKYIPRLEVLRFMDACENLLAFKKEHGELMPDEEQALRSYLDKLQALAEQRLD
jgi:hypothetical protein